MTTGGLREETIAHMLLARHPPGSYFDDLHLSTKYSVGSRHLSNMAFIALQISNFMFKWRKKLSNSQ